VIVSIANLKAFGYDRTLGERKVPGIYDIVRLGINYRMNEISAAIGLEQLNKLETFATRRAQNARALREFLAEVDELTLLPEGTKSAKHANYCLVAVLDEKTSARRSEIIMELKERGIGTSVHYPVPVPLSKYYKEKYGADPADYPNALRISNRSIALPVGPHLVSDDMRIIANELIAAITRTSS
jgi:dTDP-4-amino-4,6-dideoxygalactose transaminase